MRKPGLFFDRDGVVNHDTNFVHRREDFVFCDGIFALVRTGLELGFVPVIVTNQSGIARGIFSEDAYHQLTKWMLSVFRKEGAPIAKVYHCPYLADATVAAYRHTEHPWRKPAPGMLLTARDELDLDLKHSAMIGDRWSDAMAGEAAGLSLLALVGDRADLEFTPNLTVQVDRLKDVHLAGDWLRSKVKSAD